MCGRCREALEEVWESLLGYGEGKGIGLGVWKSVLRWGGRREEVWGSFGGGAEKCVEVWVR